MITFSSTTEHHKKIVKDFHKFKEWAPFRNDFLLIFGQRSLDEPLSISLASDAVSELPLNILERQKVPQEIAETRSETLGPRELTQTFRDRSMGPPAYEQEQ